MKADWQWTEKAKCPFFSSESAKHHRINCNEGPQHNTAIAFSFRGKDYLRQNYMRKHCCADYKSCEIYKICAKKWE